MKNKNITNIDQNDTWEFGLDLEYSCILNTRYKNSIQLIRYKSHGVEPLWLTGSMLESS